MTRTQINNNQKKLEEACIEKDCALKKVKDLEEELFGLKLV